MKIRSSSVTIFLVYIFQSLVSAQGMSEPLTNGTIELGYSHYWYKGEFYRNPENTSSSDLRSNGTIYVRMGLYDIVTLSVEGMVWPVSSSNNYPGGSFLNYTFGLALSSKTIKRLYFDLFFHVHYLDNLYLDRSNKKDDKRFRDLQIGIPLRYPIFKAFALWVAPVYNWNESVFIEDQTFSRSTNSVGISIGLDALLYQHIYLNISLEYTETILPHISAGYRF